ncbi:hypothetical protein CMK11_09320 [Candidatus Poribacteria bacterium]|nr:hypothetical protein [Candidatus Poribacteria bacterium]
MALVSRRARAELRRIHGLLETIADLAEHSELTDVEGGGEAHAAQQYNAALSRLVELEIAGDGFFVALADDASWPELRAACAQVAGYIEPEMEGGRADRSARSFSFAPNFMAAVTTEAVGKLLRDVMPEDMANEYDGEADGRADTVDFDDVESQLSELGGQMQVLAERLHRNDLSADEVKSLADQLRDLGREQTQLAEQHARARAEES